MWSIANALGLHLSEFFDNGAHDAIEVRRFGDTEVIAEQADGIVIRHLRSRNGRGDLEIYFGDFPPGCRRNAPAHGEGQVEHVIVLSGTLDVGPDGASATLGEGDCISFPADRPHHYQSLSEPCRMLAIHDYPAAENSSHPSRGA